MAEITLPATRKAFFGMKIPLDGADYFLNFEWNMRSGWYLGMQDAAGSTIFAPRKLIPRWDLLKHCIDIRRPPGVLVLLDLKLDGAEPAFDGLGTSHALMYFTLEEIEVLRASVA